jgi:hypothetical protein
LFPARFDGSGNSFVAGRFSAAPDLSFFLAEAEGDDYEKTVWCRFVWNSPVSTPMFAPPRQPTELPVFDASKSGVRIQAAVLKRR